MVICNLIKYKGLDCIYGYYLAIWLLRWSVRSPFTSEVAGSILSENFLNVTRAQCSTHVKRVSQHSAEGRGFSPGAPVSSHRDVDRVG